MTKIGSFQGRPSIGHYLAQIIWQVFLIPTDTRFLIRHHQAQGVHSMQRIALQFITQEIYHLVFLCLCLSPHHANIFIRCLKPGMWTHSEKIEEKSLIHFFVVFRITWHPFSFSEKPRIWGMHNLELMFLKKDRWMHIFQSSFESKCIK